MSARMFRREDDGAVGHDAAHSREGFYHLIDIGYARVLTWAMHHRVLVAIVALVVMFMTIPLSRVVRREFLPTGIDEAQFEMNITAPEGTAAPSMNAVMRAWETEMATMPEIRLILSTVGGGFNGAVNEGQMFVKIAPHEERIFSIGRFLKGLVTLHPLAAFTGNYSQRDVMAKVRAIGRKYPDLRVAVRNLQTFNLGGGNNEMDFIIRGPDLEALASYTEALRSRATELGLIDADTTLKLNKPELRVQIDRARAADMGVSTQDVAETLRLMVGGDQEVTRFRDPSLNEDYDVELRLVEKDRREEATISRLYVARNTGEMIRLDNLVRLEQGRSPSRVDRQDRQRQANLRSGIAPGFGLADRLDVLRDATRAMNLPPAYSTSVAGRAREFERTIGEFGWAFLLSIIFMYMVLAAQYESLLNPLLILLSLPLSLPFALFSLYIMGDTLNLYSSLGMLVLFGVVAKNAILQIDHTLNLRRQGLPRGEAILAANRDRLRPILMTTLALVGGMLPLAVGTGPGAEERRTIAVVVIGGQSLSLFLTLVVIPVAYSIVDDAAEWVRARRRAPLLAEARPN
jgi:hydrophobic/amphiphilic exporter-1 (mainly G- bacteria), HAE1 family